MASSKNRGLRLDEILEQLEKYSDGDDDLHVDEDQAKVLETHKEVTVYISPPENDDITDEDSGDENDVHLANLPGKQINSQAAIPEVSLSIPEPVSAKKLKLRQWCVEDLPQKRNCPQYSYKPSVVDVPREPHEIFQLFLDDDAIDQLTTETINYAAQSGNHQFTMLPDEMKVFVGILLLSGYCSVSRRRLYWSTELDTHNELVANSMRRNRFDEIMRYFHAADNTKICQHDKFAKIRPFMNKLNDNFISYGTAFGPSNVSIDESMIPYYGRHPTKQFIRGKPIRWGYKAWVATSPLGYAFNINLYQGKFGEEKSVSYQKNFGLGGKVILECLDILETHYPGRKFSLYFDNFFTSLRLLDEIEKRGHGATGTLRSNRVEKCPLTSNKEFGKLPRGSEEHFLDRDSNIQLVRWNDNGVVCIASNQHGLLPMKKVDRYSATERKKIAISVPHLISMYNRHMGGVDRMDENISHYRIAIRGKKWYFPVLFYLINVCVNNAWLFSREGGYTEDMLSFTRSIVQCWLKRYGMCPKNPQKERLLSISTMCTETRYDKVSHDIVESEPKSRRRCKKCHSQTIYICKKCNVPLHLKCSADYHKNQD